MKAAGSVAVCSSVHLQANNRTGRKAGAGSTPPQSRREAAYFWEERNRWFSDVWFDLIGTTQKMKKGAARLRSAAFPFELCYRLINMYSTKGDTVVDPFLGTGTTMSAAMATGRNSIGFEIESGFRDEIFSIKDTVVDAANDRIHRRLQRQLEFVQERSKEKGEFKYLNRHYKFPVMTRQEIELFFNPLENIEQMDESAMNVEYSDVPPENFEGDWKELAPARVKKTKGSQLQLF